MYLKIGKWDATVEDVEQALRELVPDIEGLTVDNDLNYPAGGIPGWHTTRSL